MVVRNNKNPNYTYGGNFKTGGINFGSAFGVEQKLKPWQQAGKDLFGFGYNYDGSIQGKQFSLDY